MSAEARETRLVLIGMMGAGKTSIGQALAERLGWPFTDTDDEIVARTGSTIPELFAHHGEAGFRRVESEVIAQTLDLPGPRVVAVGGGAVVDPGNRACLTDRATVVWLRAALATLADRVGAGDGRPMLGPPPGAGAPAPAPAESVASAALERLLTQRAPMYEEAASFVVDVDGSSVEEVVEEVAAGLAAIGGSRRA